MSFLSKIFGSGIKDTVSSVGTLAKDIKTIATGKIDPEKQAELAIKLGQLENEISKSQSSVITSETQGSWLQRHWRPVTMLIFLLLTILNQFNLLAIPLSEEVWGLFKIGIGGYIGGRTLEKAITILKK